jgi:transcriptional regulator with GAF, ATPase, and Fis domain
MKQARMDFLALLSEEQTPEKLRRKFLLLLMGFQNVERGSVWIRTKAGDTCIEALGKQSGQIKGMVLPKGKPSVVSWVIDKGRMTMAEADLDSRRSGDVEYGPKVKSKLILCFPLFHEDGSVYGAVQIIDTSAQGDRLNLDPDYLKLLQELIDVGASALGRSLAAAGLLEGARAPASGESSSSELVLGASPAFQQVMKIVRNYAATDYPVFIYGESGTGKELLAREIHSRSPRRNKPFLTQNCSAIPDTLLESELFGYKKGAFTGADRDKMGLFEAADGGTLFLDEVGEMPFNLQAKLLRVLQEHEIKPLGDSRTKTVDVRIITATNRDLQAAIRDKDFRQDLFYRLNVLPLRLPPLRERAEDVPLLARHFLKREAEHMRLKPKIISREALEFLMAYPWPGNIRELENIIKQLMVVVHFEVIELRDFPEHFLAEPRKNPSGPSLAPLLSEAPGPPEPSFEGKSWEDMERAYIGYLLEKHRWNISSAAREAQVNRSTFDSRLKRLGIQKNSDNGA